MELLATDRERLAFLLETDAALDLDFEALDAMPRRLPRSRRRRSGPNTSPTTSARSRSRSTGFGSTPRTAWNPSSTRFPARRDLRPAFNLFQQFHVIFPFFKVTDSRRPGRPRSQWARCSSRGISSAARLPARFPCARCPERRHPCAIHHSGTARASRPK